LQEERDQLQVLLVWMSSAHFFVKCD
jgi:hypothetical protein